MNATKNYLFVIHVIISFTTNGQASQVLKDSGLHKLNVFVGTWKAQNKPGSKNSTTSVYSCGWSLNGRFLICDQLINLPGGQTNNLSIYSYDSSSKRYLLSLVGLPKTDPFSIPVTSSGDTLIYSGSYEEQGIKIYTRTFNIFKNSSSYIFISQSSTDRIYWTNISEGSSVKINP